MIITQSHYDLYPSVHWEQEDEIRSKLLSVETEWRLKERIYELMETVNNQAIFGTEAEVMELLIQRANLQGKMEALKELLNDSQEAKLLLNPTA